MIHLVGFGPRCQGFLYKNSPSISGGRFDLSAIFQQLGKTSGLVFEIPFRPPLLNTIMWYIMTLRGFMILRRKTHLRKKTFTSLFVTTGRGWISPGRP